MPDITANISVEVDARGLNCPMPLLKAKLALNSCKAGEVIKVLATDGGSVRDFHAFANLSAHTLVHFVEHGEYYEYHLQKGILAEVATS